MAEDPQSIVFDILVKIQGELASTRSDIGQLRAELGALRADVSGILPRLDRVEDLLHKQRRSMAGMMVSMTAVTGEFDGRGGRLERRVAILEER